MSSVFVLESPGNSSPSINLSTKVLVEMGGEYENSRKL